MKKILFVSDLDNTLLFSWKKSHLGDFCVEKKDGFEQGFMTEFTFNSLEIINKITTFIPVTSRSLSQYQRIDWNDNQLPQYVLVANGGILLKGGKIDLEWLKESQELVKPYKKEMYNLCDSFRNKEEYKICRIVDDMYVYVHCFNDLQVADCVNQHKTPNQFEVVSQGRKVYFFPPAINKGIAVERLKERITYEKMIVAGDSIIDLSMLQKSDVAIIPKELESSEWYDSVMVDVCDEIIFSDYICKQVLKYCHDR